MTVVGLETPGRALWREWVNAPGSDRERYWTMMNPADAEHWERLASVLAERQRGAVTALKSIALSDHDHPEPGASDLRTRAFAAWRTATRGQ